jgi:hypothetical protein
MALDLFFKEDIQRVLVAAAANLAATQAANPALDEERADAYRQGFTDALQVAAFYFGVAAPTDSPPRRPLGRTIDAPGWRKGAIDEG